MKTGYDLVEILKKHIGEPYIMGTLVPKDDAAYDGPWDCAEFVSWGIYQISGILYGCLRDTAAAKSADAYTGYWDRDAHSLGKIITVDEAARTAGAAILRVAGNGEVGHIVCSEGNGHTVEAHGHADGVIQSVVSGRRWDYGILVPGIQYTTMSALSGVAVVPPTTTIYHLTQPMMVSKEIGAIQSALNRLGFPTGGVDNIYGTGTMRAVQSFQKSKGLLPDGEVGPLTLHDLNLK